MNNEVKEIIIDLMTELYAAKGYTDISLAQFVGERNVFETRMKETYDKLDALIGACDEATAQDYEEEIDCLEEDIRMLVKRRDELCEENKILEDDKIDLINRNYDLAQENMKLWERINAISKMVNDTWC